MVNKQKILIVDDDENIAELISLYLTKECFDTMMVHDGEEALVAFDTYQPNLMLLDLMLPGIDGYQVCREIRARSNTPIIMLSANQVFTREQLLDQIWGYEYIGDTRTVDVHIKRLREKIKDHATWGLATVWGIGYKFEVK